MRASTASGMEPGCSEILWNRVWKMKGGLLTHTTPMKSASPAATLGMLMRSRRTRAERKMVTTGQAKMMQSASGTGIRVKLVVAQHSIRPAAKPEV